MNWVDLVIILLLVFFSLDGVGKSFILETIDFISFLLAFFLSLKFYNVLANIFEINWQIPHSFSTIIGFIGLWILIEMVFLTLTHFVLSYLKFLKTFDNILKPFSFIPAMLRGLVFIAIILVLVGSFPIQPRLKLSVEQSKLGSIILTQSQKLERPLKQVFGEISEQTLTFLTIKPRSDQSINLGFQTSEFIFNNELENRMLVLVNQERVKRAKLPLVNDDKLKQVARNHSADMFNNGYFSHYSPEGKTVADRADDFGLNYLVIGENLAYAPILDLAHSGLMNSTGHRENILSDDFKRVGIGIMDGGVYGLMFTQVFSN